MANILIVEDEALIAMLVEDSVNTAGHTVVGVADTVADAIEMVEKSPPELVLCDIKLLNGDSGLDVAAFLSERHIPCLFVSGNCPNPDDGRGLALGCMLKPFRPARLEEAIDTALAVARGILPGELPTGLTLY